eukprot:CAMPEP_0197522446 /NCGR_PEP_ID=MMETSP1318-20131121/7590_1 /TAXON_ID=552666 /ORGANISM="Partenskyella glossopodia, Strain RCC365" /LENGTH=607 /DNA_ID=CAMNT_0043074835 /DNA_START=379 /DNA_END=2202 /DNA_ORIENTATION=+
MMSDVGVFGDPGSSWGATTQSDCSQPIVVKQIQFYCETQSSSENENCNGTTQNLSIYTDFYIERHEYTIASTISLIDYSSGAFNFDTATFFDSVGAKMFISGVHGGAANYGDGPPTMYSSVGYYVFPPGAFSDSSLKLTGTNSYILYDSWYTYQTSQYTSGVGTGTYTDVTFTQLRGSLSSIEVLGQDSDQNATISVCSSSTGPQVCISTFITGDDTTYEGFNLDGTSTKANVFINSITYPSSHNSGGLRMLAVSTSYSGTVSLDETGDEASQSSETFGAAYFITQKNIQVSPNAITTQNPGSTVTVQRLKQSLTDDGTLCGYTSGDWFSEAVTMDGRTFNTAQDFFEYSGFPDMECLFYSFPANNASETNMMWDPILGVDPVAAQYSTNITTSSSTTTSSSSGVCFHADSKVVLESGEAKRIEELKWGERVQVASADGEISFSDIVYIPHSKNNKQSRFVQITTTDNVVKMTKYHFVMASETCEPGSFALTYAKNVKAGHCLDGTKGAEVVKDVALVNGNGLYTVVAAHSDGIIVVDGIKASSFAESHSFTNSYYNIHRFLHSLFGHEVMSKTASAHNVISDIFVEGLYFGLMKPAMCAARLASCE